MVEDREKISQKPIETYIKEVEELAKTMPKIERIEIKRKFSFSEKIKNFFTNLKK